jgi:hypothetical protein
MLLVTEALLDRRIGVKQRMRQGVANDDAIIGLIDDGFVMAVGAARLAHVVA